MRTMVNVLSLDMTYDDNDETLFQVASEDINTQPEGSFLQNETVATFRKKRNKMQPETWIAGRRGVVPAGKRRSTKNGTGN